MFIKVCCKGYRSFSFTTVMQFLHGLYYNCHAISIQIVLQGDWSPGSVNQRRVFFPSKEGHCSQSNGCPTLLSFLAEPWKESLPKQLQRTPCQRNYKGVLAKGITKESFLAGLWKHYLEKELQRNPCQRNYKGIFPCWTVKAILGKGITKESLQGIHPCRTVKAILAKGIAKKSLQPSITIYYETSAVKCFHLHLFI